MATDLQNFLLCTSSQSTLFKTMKVGTAEFAVHQWLVHQLDQARKAEAIVSAPAPAIDLEWDPATVRAHNQAIHLVRTMDKVAPVVRIPSQRTRGNS